MGKNLLGILFTFFTFILLFVTHFKPAYGASCTVTTSPDPVTSDHSVINFTIKTEGLYTRKFYWITLGGKVIGTDFTTPFPMELSDSEILFVGQVGPSAITNPPPFFDKKFEAKAYEVAVQEVGGGVTFCTDSFVVVTAGSGSFGGSKVCKIEFQNDNFSSKDEIKFKITTGDTTGERRYVLKRGGRTGRDIRIPGRKDCELTSNLVNSEQSLGKLEDGEYYLEVQDCTPAFSGTFCYATFTICKDCKKTASGGLGRGRIFPPICKPVDEDQPRKGFLCQTAIGEINTRPDKLVEQLVTWVLGIAGGVAVLLIIFSGYQMMISGGNPEKLQEAKDRLTSAIVGLVFIIFSLALLQIIGVDILGIQGFEP